MSGKIFRLFLGSLCLFQVGSFVFASPGSPSSKAKPKAKQRNARWYPPKESKRAGLFCSCIASGDISDWTSEIADLKNELIAYDVSGEISPFLAEKLDLYEETHLNENNDLSSIRLSLDQRLSRLMHFMSELETCLSVES